MSAPTQARPLCSDAELVRRLAGADGVSTNKKDDPRLEQWAMAGLIRPFGSRWRWVVRRPSSLTPEQRDYIADDQAAKLREESL